MPGNRTVGFGVAGGKSQRGHSASIPRYVPPGQARKRMALCIVQLTPSHGHRPNPQAHASGGRVGSPCVTGIEIGPALLWREQGAAVRRWAKEQEAWMEVFAKN
jgi:hypothetical protein